VCSRLALLSAKGASLSRVVDKINFLPMTPYPIHTRASQARARPRWLHLLYVLWVLPVSMCALPLAPLALYRARWRICDGVLEVSSPAIAWFLRGPWFRALAGGTGFAAATIGHVVIARSVADMAACRSHEHVHVRQCERWGALFPLAYVIAGLRAAQRERSWRAYYHANPFELEAYAAEARQLRSFQA
jgi:hypothetical protein